MLVIDAVTRLLPGALGNDASAQNESFSAGSSLPAGAQYMDIASLQLSDKHLASDHPLAESNGVLLDYPHYTRPAEVRGWAVPEILIGGRSSGGAKLAGSAGGGKTRPAPPEFVCPELNHPVYS